MHTKLFAVTVRAAPLKVTHDRWIDTGLIKPKRFQSTIKQIGRPFVASGKDIKISGGNSEVLHYFRQFQPVTRRKLIERGSFPPKGSPEFHQWMY
jgi:hypothetical protein